MLFKSISQRVDTNPRKLSASLTIDQENYTKNQQEFNTPFSNERQKQHIIDQNIIPKSIVSARIILQKSDLKIKKVKSTISSREIDSTETPKNDFVQSPAKTPKNITENVSKSLEASIVDKDLYEKYRHSIANLKSIKLADTDITQNQKNLAGSTNNSFSVKNNDGFKNFVDFMSHYKNRVDQKEDEEKNLQKKSAYTTAGERVSIKVEAAEQSKRYIKNLQEISYNSFNTLFDTSNNRNNIVSDLIAGGVQNSYNFQQERDQVLKEDHGSNVIETKTALNQLDKMSRYDELFSLDALLLKYSETNTDQLIQEFVTKDLNRTLGMHQNLISDNFYFKEASLDNIMNDLYLKRKHFETDMKIFNYQLEKIKIFNHPTKSKITYKEFTMMESIPETLAFATANDHLKKSKIVYKKFARQDTVEEKLAFALVQKNQSQFEMSEGVFINDENEAILHESIGTIIWRGTEIKPTIIKRIMKCECSIYTKSTIITQNIMHSFCIYSLYNTFMENDAPIKRNSKEIKYPLNRAITLNDFKIKESTINENISARKNEKNYLKYKSMSVQSKSQSLNYNKIEQNPKLKNKNSLDNIVKDTVQKPNNTSINLDIRSPSAIIKHRDYNINPIIENACDEDSVNACDEDSVNACDEDSVNEGDEDSINEGDEDSANEGDEDDESKESLSNIPETNKLIKKIAEPIMLLRHSQTINSPMKTVKVKSTSVLNQKISESKKKKKSNLSRMNTLQYMHDKDVIFILFFNN